MHWEEKRRDVQTLSLVLTVTRGPTRGGKTLFGPKPPSYLSPGHVRLSYGHPPYTRPRPHHVDES